ncbi:MAG: hypothetical protein IJQ34_09305 [Kiritimatiellae bacterium]|nr:hypothetical protein [Kiritimatiellia bacterium]
MGYTTTSVQGKVNDETTWYQVAIQFKGVGETSDKIKLGDAIKSDGLTATTWRNRNTAPCLQFYNGTGYDMYYYISQAYPDSTKTAGSNTITGWANSVQVLAEDTYLDVGKAFWFKADNIASGETVKLTVAGTVSSETEKTITIGDSAWTLAANPFPVAVAVKDIGCSLPATTWRNRNSAPCIQVYNGSGYDLYYYISQAYPDSTKTAGTNTITGWANSVQVLATDEIPAGSGFWVKTSGTEEGTLTFSL